jgi:hypothetical protein
MISNMVKDVVSGTSTDTCSKDTSMSWGCEVRDEDPRERPLTRSIACTSSFTNPNPVPSLEDQTGQDDQPLCFVTNYCGSSKPPVLVSPKESRSLGRDVVTITICGRPLQAPQWDALPMKFAPLPNIWNPDHLA